MQKTLKNRTIFCRDNLEIMRGIDSETIDLIYLDPPFNTNKEYIAPIGTTATGASFKDIFKEEDVKDEEIGLLANDFPVVYEFIYGVTNVGFRYNKYYLIYMAVRLLEMHRVLKPTGSIYLHCNQTMSHYLKLLMDCIFGEKNFISEIIWNYGTPSGGRVGGKKPVKVHDSLFSYSKVYGKHLYNKQFTEYSESYKKNWFRHSDGDRAYRTRSRKGKNGATKIIRQYLDESLGVPLSSVWSDIKQNYSKRGWFPTTQNKLFDYPTEKPLLLLERIVLASSNDGDIVLDPFCGCATTCIAAEKLGRQWIGIDISKMAFTLVKIRMGKELDSLFQKNVIEREDIPERTDTGEPIEIKDIQILYGKQDGYCSGCNIHFYRKNLTIDHIVPTSKGGGDNINNLQLLCANCNSRKGNRDMAFLLKSLKKDDII